MLKSKTPDNIDELTLNDLLPLVSNPDGVKPAVVRLRILQMLYKVFGYDVSNDQLLMLLAEPKAKLCIAPAGGGKTTNANIQVFAEKIYRSSRVLPGRMIQGDKILCLVYNKHNVKDFYDRHVEMYNTLKASGIKNLNIDSDLQVKTMHSFCDTWRREYAVETNLMGFKLAEESEAIKLMKTAMETAFRKAGRSDADKFAVSNLYSLYTYQNESMMSFDESKDVDKFIDLKMPLEILQDSFKFYDSLKKTKKLYDYTDMLVSIYKLLTERPAILKHIQQFYEYVIVDEVQDFTPLMMEILKLFVNNGTPLMCIGDDDQSIYGFRGADIYNTLDFENKFDGGEVYILLRNRRCRQKILDTATKIISMNTLRFDKQLKCVKDGGNVEYIPYNTVEGQALNVIDKLSSYSRTELHSTVVCTRDKEGTILIAQELAEHNIPFHVISGYHAYTHELYRHVTDVLNVLDRPMDMYAQLNLYKVLPVKREQLYSILMYDPKKQRFSDDAERRHFTRIEYGALLNRQSFTDALAKLATISNMIKTEPMSKYFTVLFDMIKQYFWTTKKNYNTSPVLDEIFEQKVFKYFNQPRLYKDVHAEYLNRKDKYKKYQNSSMGLAISTFHSLKGLEFNNVFLLNLDNDEFPNFQLIDRKDYSDEMKLSLKETETRLFYVAITRARNNLFMYYQQSNPSLYVKRLLEDTDDSETVNEVLDDSEDEIIFDASDMSSAESKSIDSLIDEEITEDTEELDDLGEDLFLNSNSSVSNEVDNAMSSLDSILGILDQALDDETEVKDSSTVAPKNVFEGINADNTAEESNVMPDVTMKMDFNKSFMGNLLSKM